jgi:glycosyltransferase involved in cell wall biosynthesis
MIHSGRARVDITIIIPTYNRLWCLPDAIASCRGNVCSAEIIVVDDGSTDGTWEWLQTQADVHTLRQQNAGKDWAVNKAFGEARGEFIRFLDSDDMLVPTANDLQLKAGRDNKSDVVTAGYIVQDDILNTKRTQPWIPCDDFIAQQLGECDSSHYSAYLFRREFVADIPHRPEFTVRDDRMFVIEVAFKHPRVSYVEEPALIHRHHSRERLQFPKGLKLAVTNHAHWEIYKKAVQGLNAGGSLTDRRRRAISKSLWPLAHWVSYTDLHDACRLYAWILELDPTFVPPDEGVLGFMYRTLGFYRTEQVLHVRRFLRNCF